MEPTEIHASHPPQTGHRWLDIALAGAAVLVSLVSLYVAVDNGRAMERLVAANSWPNLYFDVELTEGSTPESFALNMKLANNGIGPARLETLEIWSGAQPLASVVDVLAALKNTALGAPVPARIAGMTAVGSVIGIGETRELLEIALSEATLRMPAVEFAGLIESRVCFCSVFEECRVADSRVDNGRPRIVEHCRVPEVPYQDDLTRSLPTQNASTPRDTVPSVAD